MIIVNLLSQIRLFAVTWLMGTHDWLVV